MSANPPQDAPQPDYSGAPPWPASAAQAAPDATYPPAPESYAPAVPAYPPIPNYPPAPSDYAAPPAAPAYPSMPLGTPYVASGYPQPGYPQPGYPPAGYSQTGYPPAGYAPYGYAAPVQSGVSGNAIASIICAAVGAVLIVAGLGLGALSADAAARAGQATNLAYESPAILVFVTGIAGLVALALSIPAVVTGHIGLGKIKRSGGALTGHAAALAGVILGYIEIAVPVVCVIAFIALALASVGAG